MISYDMKKYFKPNKVEKEKKGTVEQKKTKSVTAASPIATTPMRSETRNNELDAVFTQPRNSYATINDNHLSLNNLQNHA